MYKEHFNLSKNPFENTPDPKFLFLGGDYRETLALLKHTVVARKGVVCIAGPIGCGKTMLAAALVENLPDRSIVISPSFPKGTQKDLAVYIASKLGLQHLPESQLLIHEMMKTKLIEMNEQGRVGVLILDEAQFLDDALFEEILFLANLETGQYKLIQIILLGQMELLDKLNHPARHQLAQRITKIRILSPLNRMEAEQYMLHRLQLSESSGEIFSKEAVELIIRHSEGIPRNINRLCDTSLLNAFIKQKNIVEVDDVRKAIRDIGLKVFGKQFVQLPEVPYLTTSDLESRNQKSLRHEELRFGSFKHHSFMVSAALIIACIFLVIIFTKLEHPSLSGNQEKNETELVEDKLSEKKLDMTAEADNRDAQKEAEVVEKKSTAEPISPEEEKTEINIQSVQPNEESTKIVEGTKVATEERPESSEAYQDVKEEPPEIEIDDEESAVAEEEFQTTEENEELIQEEPVDITKAESRSTPYTILLSSFRKQSEVMNALRQYKQMGLLPFFTKVDLGEKGVWYGIFSGHYENVDQAAQEIFAFHLTNAVVKKAEYTVFIGEYDSENTARNLMNTLKGEGFSGYLLCPANGKVNLYSGAFYTQEAAVDHSRELTSFGPVCRVVKW